MISSLAGGEETGFAPTGVAIGVAITRGAGVEGVLLIACGSTSELFAPDDLLQASDQNSTEPANRNKSDEVSRPPNLFIIP